MTYEERFGKFKETIRKVAYPAFSKFSLVFWLIGEAFLVKLLINTSKYDYLQKFVRYAAVDGTKKEEFLVNLPEHVNALKGILLVLIVAQMVYGCFLVIIPTVINTKSNDDRKKDLFGWIIIAIYIIYNSILVYSLFSGSLIYNGIHGFIYGVLHKDIENIGLDYARFMVFYICVLTMEFISLRPSTWKNYLFKYCETSFMRSVRCTILFAILALQNISVVCSYWIGNSAKTYAAFVSTGKPLYDFISLYNMRSQKILLLVTVFVLLRLIVLLNWNYGYNKLKKERDSVERKISELLTMRESEGKPEIFGLGYATKWMTNSEALRYFENKYYTDPCGIITWRSPNEYNIIHSLYEINGHYYVKDKYSVRAILPYELAVRLNKTVNLHVLNDVSEVLLKEYNQWIGLKKGYAGEENVYRYFMSTISNIYPETKLIRSCNLIGNDKTQSVEHDMIIVNRKGLVTVEIKNYAGRILIENTGRIVRENSVVGENENFIIQSNNHIANLTGVMNEKHVNVNVNGIVVFAESKTNVINHSTYPIFTYPMIIDYLRKLPDSIDTDDVDEIVNIIGRRSRSDKKFPFTVHTISDDFWQNWRERLQEYDEFYKLLKKHNVLDDKIGWYPKQPPVEN